MTIFLVVSAFSLDRVEASEGAAKVVLLFPSTYGDEARALAAPVYDMLNTRLSSRGFSLVSPEQELVLDKGARPTASFLEMVFKGTGADFVIAWSLTRFGDSVSIDLLVYEEGSLEPRGVYSSLKVAGIIPGIDEVAEKLSTEGLKLKPSAPAVPEPVKKAPEKAAPPPPPLPQVVPPPVPAPSVFETGPAAKVEKFFGEKKILWQGEGFKVRDGAMGDLDGDGKDEIVLIEYSKAHVLGYRDGRLDVIQTVDLVRDSFSVSIADINNNGRAEVFISAYGKYLKSTVLEWRGKGLREVSKRQDWFFRVLEVPGKGLKLFGQKAAFNGERSGSVYELVWDGKGYVRGQELDLPRGAEVYNFAFIDMDGGPGFVVLSEESKKLAVHDPGGKLLVRTKKRYDGSLNVYEADYGPERSDEKLEENLHGRLEFRVLQKMVWIGDKRVLVIKNIQGLVFFKKHSGFKSGELAVLEWDGLTMQELEKTLEMPFYLASTMVGDLDGDGLKEAVAVGIENIESLWGTVKAVVLGYPFER